MGGKAGANLINKVYEEHGYHVFPAWYTNTLALFNEIGISANLIPITKFHYLIAPDSGKRKQKNKGVFPDTIEFHQLDSLRAYIHNIFSGIVPWYEALLSFYAVIDLCSQPLKRSRFLDRVSVNGFLHSRWWYVSDIMAKYHQQTVLQASAIPNYELSAMTLKNLVNYWCLEPTPLFRILNGDLQQKFIHPLEQYVLRQGAKIRMNTKVKSLVPNNKQICELQLETAGGVTTTEKLSPQDVCIITTPLDVTSKFVTDSVFACEEKNIPNRDPERVKPISYVNYLESAPMAAFQFYFRRKISGIPAEHVNLYESTFGLSFIDVSQIWHQFTNNYTVLSVIASDFKPLKTLSEKEASLHLGAAASATPPG